ncbi:TIR domain-containing protein [Rubellimicrobium aerolatum]|uniref:TIR domain-containing protein n=1 Tax=Rubellimicrobium aerolatum TaxID=490979 RepID=A0ABW0S8T3_9RHOB|nr:TIR domain-containing protein [Rubellimicrobium aerolatum]MBP1804673.1 putative nucleotide-binding protein [Rubellimicrobium aerolatum]
MIERFQGDKGRRLLVEVLGNQKMLQGAAGLPEAVAERGDLREMQANEILIEQGADTNDVFLIIAGVCDVMVNGRTIAKRGPGEHVGEMAAVQPTQPRSATVRAGEKAVVLRLSEEAFSDLASRHPSIYRAIAQELSKRLLERNKTIGAYRERIRLFVISSREALAVARMIQNQFEHDPIDVELWTQGCFRAMNYTLQDLEEALDRADFAVAVAHADDVTESRDERWPAPRDNVVLELGLAMGRLGRSRALLMEPRGVDLKLPSDLLGITTIPYRFEKGGENDRLMGPACDKLREHMLRNGPANG